MAHTPTTWIELNKTALDYNIAQFRHIIGTSKLAFVIKANAYGHGMIPVAAMIAKNNNIDWVCVANYSDALTLLSTGLNKPILVLSCIDENPEKAINTSIAFAVYNQEMIDNLNAIGARHDYKFPIHLKIDTGLSRLGVNADNALTFIKKILTYKNITLQGVYSHFAESNKVESDHTNNQIKKFNDLLDQLEENHITIPYIHLANSAATMKFTLPRCNMVRVGASLYGLWPSPETKKIAQAQYPEFDLVPILSWKTTIIHIQQISAGQSIGYDQTFIAPRDMRIACIPTGYYDGYDFRLYNQASVKIGSHYAPIIGRISMNITTIDITDIPLAQLESHVTLMDNDERIHPYTLGMMVNNPNVREIVTKINPAITRIIVEKEIFQNKNIPYTTYSPKHQTHDRGLV